MNIEFRWAFKNWNDRLQILSSSWKIENESEIRNHFKSRLEENGEILVKVRIEEIL